jgi:hypothetical protein
MLPGRVAIQSAPLDDLEIQGIMKFASPIEPSFVSRAAEPHSSYSFSAAPRGLPVELIATSEASAG